MRKEKRDPVTHRVPFETTSARHHSKDLSPVQRTTPAEQRKVTTGGFAAAPAGRRTSWAVIVPRCPFCQHLHLHRATGPHGGRRTASCGREYVIVLAGRGKGAA